MPILQKCILEILNKIAVISSTYVRKQSEAKGLIEGWYSSFVLFISIMLKKWSS